MRWQAFQQVCLYQFRLMNRSKVALFFNLIFPLLMLLIFATLFPDGGQGAAALMPGLMALMFLSAGLVTVGMALATQRETGAHRHLFSTPLPLSLWTAGRLLASLALTGLQLVVLYGFAMVLFKVAPPGNLGGTLLLAAVSTMAATGMGLLIGASCDRSESALGVTMVLYMTLAALGGAMVPIEMGPGFLQTVARFTPSFYMVDGFMALAVRGHGLGSVWAHLGVLAGVGLATLALGIWQLRRQLASG